LLARLIDIFTDVDDMVLELFGGSADIAAVALKKGRRFISISGPSRREREILKGCAVLRLRAVVDGKDRALEESEGEIRMRGDAYIPYDGGGSFVIAEIAPWLAERRFGEEFPVINRGEYTNPDKLRSALLTAEGYIPVPDGPADGISFDGRSIAIYISPSEFLTPEMAAERYDAVDDGARRKVIYYFRASDDFDQSVMPDGFVSRRVPMELMVK
jgi:hypothetical protein